MQTEKNEVFNIEFDYEDTGSYYFYNFIDSLTKLVNEGEIILENNEMIIEFMDPSRISLARMVKDIDYFEEIRKFGLNFDDLAKIVKTRKTKSQKNLRLRFFNSGVYKIIAEKYSPNDSTVVSKSLSLLDIDMERIPMDNLLEIEYPTKFVLTNKQLEDLFYEVGIYSEILNIEVNKRKVEFSESGQIGKMEYPFERSQLNDFESHDTEPQRGAYSLSFLKCLKPLLSIIDKDAWITFHLKSDHPLFVSIDIPEVGFKLEYFLAPRVEETEFDDEEDIDDF